MEGKAGAEVLSVGSRTTGSLGLWIQKRPRNRALGLPINESCVPREPANNLALAPKGAVGEIVVLEEFPDGFAPLAAGGCGLGGKWEVSPSFSCFQEVHFGQPYKTVLPNSQ